MGLRVLGPILLVFKGCYAQDDDSMCKKSDELGLVQSSTLCALLHALRC